MLGQKAVGFLCFGCFIIHSIFLVYSNNNQQSVDNSKYQDLFTIPFPLKIQITVEPGKRHQYNIIELYILSFIVRFQSIAPGHGGLWWNLGFLFLQSSGCSQNIQGKKYFRQISTCRYYIYNSYLQIIF